MKKKQSIQQGAKTYRTAKSSLSKLFLIIYFPFLVLALLIIINVKANASERELDLKGEKLEYFTTTKRVHARENVVLEYEDMTLETDELEYSLISEDGLASGNISITLPEGVSILSDKVQFNLKTRWWKTPYADIRIEPSTYIYCEEAEQKDKNSISLKRLSFTSCPEERPIWKITGKRGILNTKGSVKIRDITLRVKGLPVFYLPYAYIPFVEAKEKGLQPPEMGHSSRHGYFIKNTLTWPVTSKINGDIYIDYFTETGPAIGFGWEYMEDQIPSETLSDGARIPLNKMAQNSKGRLYLLYEDETDLLHGEADISMSMGASDEKRLVAEIHSTTERGFYRNLSSDSTKRDMQIQESRVFISKYNKGLSLIAKLEHLRDLNDSLKQDAILLPELSAQVLKIPIKMNGLHLAPLIGLYASGSYILWDANNTNEEDARISFQPEVLIPFMANQWITVTSTLSTIQTYYETTDDSLTGWCKKDMLEMTVTGTRLFKTYKRKEMNSNVIHMLYPQIRYRLEKHSGISPLSITNIETETDEIEDITILIINRVLQGIHKEKGLGLQSLELILSETFNRDDDVDILHVNALTRFNGLLNLDFRMAFDTRGRKKRDSDINIGIGNTETGKISLGWRYLWGENGNEAVNLANLIISSKSYGGYRIETTFQYDFESEVSIEEKYGLFYTASCWKSSLHYINRYNEDIFRVNLSLVF